MKSAIVLVAALATTFVSMPAVAHDGDHSLHKWKCEAWKTRIRKNRPHFAYAANDEGTHCGMAYGSPYLNEAERGALKNCETYSDSTCRLIYSR